MTVLHPVIAVDIDLHSIYAWCSVCGQVCNDDNDLSTLKLHISSHFLEQPLVLVEVAGAVDYSDNKAIAHNKRRWTIWNIATAASLHCYCAAIGLGHCMQVAPSSKWTKGHDVKVRHGITAADAKNKDLRECQSMIWFHARHPEDWVPWVKFLLNL